MQRKLNGNSFSYFSFSSFFCMAKVFSKTKKKEISYNMILGFNITEGEDGKTRRPLKTHKKGQISCNGENRYIHTWGKIAYLNQSIATTFKKKGFFLFYLSLFFSISSLLWLALVNTGSFSLFQSRLFFSTD